MLKELSKWGPNNEYYKVPIHVVYNDEVQSTYMDIQDGIVYLHTIPAMYRQGREDLKAHACRYIDKFLNPLPNGVYIRCHFDPADYEHIKKGDHTGSINHATGEEEGGLSVALSIEGCGKYVYLVSGTEIGHGTDGEPLLDISTVKVASRRMRFDSYYDTFYELRRKRAESLGLTNEELTALLSGRLLVFDGCK